MKLQNQTNISRKPLKLHGVKKKQKFIQLTGNKVCLIFSANAFKLLQTRGYSKQISYKSKALQNIYLRLQTKAAS